MADKLDQTELRFVTPDGERVVSSVSEEMIARLARAQPVRFPPSYAGQRHYPGLCWTRTTRGHVVYESLMERDRILLADYDSSVTWIAPQPFWIQGSFGGRQRRHCPDLLLTRADGTFVVVDVKKPSGRRER